MISLNNYATQAVQKLEEGKKAVSGQKEKAMAPAVMAQLKAFCKQDEEFAQAVVQGGTLAECMKKVATGVGGAISDLDAYKKAVQFYFPGAEVGMKLTLDLVGKAAETQEAEAPALMIHKEYALPELSLEDFF